jgi:hypothetical protein
MYKHKDQNYQRPHQNYTYSNYDLKALHSTYVKLYLSTYLIATLASLDMYDFPHFASLSLLHTFL